jgi:hypothetical protein
MHNTAALIADTFEFSSDGLRADMTSDAMIGACEHAGDMVGNRLLELLLRSKHNEDPILVQLSLQACLGVYALWIVSSWHFELHGEESFLEKIYDSMRRRGEVTPLPFLWLPPLEKNYGLIEIHTQKHRSCRPAGVL